MLLRRDWEWYFPKNKQMGIITQSPMSATPSQPMKRTIIPPNLNSGIEIGYYGIFYRILLVPTILGQNQQ